MVYETRLPYLLPGIILGVAIGAAIGVGAYTFVYAHGYSYLTDNPEACANCHIMQDQFNGWVKSSHRSVAVCNDCHTPPGFVGKYATKARNGFWHSYYFTTGWFDDNIHITPRGREVTEEACRKCHVIRTLSMLSRAAPGSERRAHELYSLSRFGWPPALVCVEEMNG